MPSCSNPLFLSVKIVKIYNCKGYGEVEDENEREAITETGMLGLVMPDFHAEKGTEAAAKESDGEKTCFRDTPFVMPRLPFVDAIQEERDYVYSREVEQETI